MQANSIFLNGERGVRADGRTMFLYNTTQVILQNFAATVMSVVRRRKKKSKTKYAHKWNHNANKASHRCAAFQQDCHLVSTVSIILPDDSVTRGMHLIVLHFPLK